MATSLRSSTKVLFDTNVLLSAFIFKKTPAEVYQYCAERYTLYTSEWLLNELAEILKREKFKLPLSLQVAILQQVRIDAQLVNPTNNLPTDSRDPDDNNVLQVALFVKADFIITGDRDLLDLKQVIDTVMISPATFYERYIG
ncbi:putative toxin-antitoxin system toxin component, PIN family [Spirosoma fluviale]|uniref:Putative toxin-antitoxin system toxin component, PIN family n=1 Tax=Spirosoma fluviale TaxID=1597977 RepID=A0A286G171_9BACT|nr:putative toxin-antitoxin system toxin component, PIN family [Spirosoma fluviale]SOD88724.1 putative toxin-antitoxin system toxin component, PIN family [Spirosoma fluviale]